MNKSQLFLLFSLLAFANKSTVCGDVIVFNSSHNKIKVKSFEGKNGISVKGKSVEAGQSRILSKETGRNLTVQFVDYSLIGKARRGGQYAGEGNGTVIDTDKDCLIIVINARMHKGLFLKTVNEKYVQAFKIGLNIQEQLDKLRKKANKHVKRSMFSKMIGGDNLTEYFETLNLGLDQTKLNTQFKNIKSWLDQIEKIRMIFKKNEIQIIGVFQELKSDLLEIKRTLINMLGQEFSLEKKSNLVEEEEEGELKLTSFDFVENCEKPELSTNICHKDQERQNVIKPIERSSSVPVFHKKKKKEIKDNLQRSFSVPPAPPTNNLNLSNNKHSNQAASNSKGKLLAQIKAGGFKLRKVNTKQMQTNDGKNQQIAKIQMASKFNPESKLQEVISSKQNIQNFLRLDPKHIKMVLEKVKKELGSNQYDKERLMIIIKAVYRLSFNEKLENYINQEFSELVNNLKAGKVFPEDFK